MQIRLSSNITVKELLDQHPRLMSSLVKLGLLCGGCPTEAFHTLADVARENGISLDQLLQQLQNAIDNSMAK